MITGFFAMVAFFIIIAGFFALVVAVLSITDASG